MSALVTVLIIIVVLAIIALVVVTLRKRRAGKVLIARTPTRSGKAGKGGGGR